ncbi:tRNA lysidine(34) synthetase TilS [Candidatus Leptofilum sp.]|uniref:tRNA lysidine(34) synthetase TilS n=1 Tax=Candidatus Leptofilum sp. TaxID=3241576 RepID=UPI003B596C64
MTEASSFSKEDRRLWRAVLRAVRPFPLSTPHTKLLIGVSGGADSLALLHLLWQQVGAGRLVVAHLNHQLRPEAAADAEFVVETAASWGIPCKMGRVDVAALAEQSRLSLEAAGRLARYQFLASTADEVIADAVLVGHHADDQAETVLLHLLRGSGSSGLQGMRPVGVVPGSEGMVLLRPFLTTSRAEIEAYCIRHRLTPRQDASNEDVQFTRNRIRHELLPLLQTYNPQIRSKLQQIATVTADELAVLQEQFEEIWPTLVIDQAEDFLLLDRTRFQALAVAWQRLALRNAVQQLRPQVTEIGFQTVELARNLILEKESGTEAWLPGALEIRVAAETVAFGTSSGAQLAFLPQLIDEQAQPLSLPGQVQLANGWAISATVVAGVSLAEIQQNEDVWQAFVAVAEVDDLWVRPYQPHERFQPLGMDGQSQKIVDLLSNRKVEQVGRPLWPIVATSKHPVWIVGQHVDNRARVTDESLRIVSLLCYQRKSR